MVARIAEEVPWPVTVVATGGLATTIAQNSARLDRVDEQLMLEGLRLLHERNL